jgi:hypothetical protein
MTGVAPQSPATLLRKRISYEQRRVLQMEQQREVALEEQRQEEEEEQREEERDRLANPSLYDDLAEEQHLFPEIPTDTALTEDHTPLGDLDGIESSTVEETVFEHHIYTFPALHKHNTPQQNYTITKRTLC